VPTAGAAGHPEDTLANPEGFGLEALDEPVARYGNVLACHVGWFPDEIPSRAEAAAALALPIVLRRQGLVDIMPVMLIRLTPHA
jgi:hypothetical protein